MGPPGFSPAEASRGGYCRRGQVVGDTVGWARPRPREAEVLITPLGSAALPGQPRLDICGLAAPAEGALPERGGRVCTTELP